MKYIAHREWNVYKPCPLPLKKNHTLNTEIDMFINIAAFSERHNTTTKLPFTVFTDLYIMNSDVRSFPGKMKTWREMKRTLQQPSILLLARTDTRRLTTDWKCMILTRTSWRTDYLATVAPVARWWIIQAVVCGRGGSGAESRLKLFGCKNTQHEMLLKFQG